MSVRTYQGKEFSNRDGGGRVFNSVFQSLPHRTLQSTYVHRFTESSLLNPIVKRLACNSFDRGQCMLASLACRYTQTWCKVVVGARHIHLKLEVIT